MSNPLLCLVCFSRNRPLQLDGYLRSVQRWFSPSNQLQVHVLYKTTPPFKQAYSKLRDSFPNVKFKEDTVFAKDLLELIGSYTFICMGCDDAVYLKPVNIVDIVNAFDKYSLGLFSLRLGANLSRSMFSGKMRLPKLNQDGELIRWSIRSAKACGDWGYPWEVSGTIYRSEAAKKVIMHSNPSNPSMLESKGNGFYTKFNVDTAACYTHSRMIIPTVNVVQNVFKNPICGPVSISPEVLLSCWNSGLRLDLDALERLKYSCIHVPEFMLYRQF